MEILGWIGAACFAVCASPQAWVCFKQKHANGVSGPFLMLWILGEVLTLIYMWPKQDWPVLFNLLSNLFFLSVIVRYKVWPKTNGKFKKS